ncbi:MULTISPECIES: hypothetical protein [Actinoalloteichus]|uniref:Uncharacterized protein n=1 Tax=Actinoalloteichus fjordicus TaxID=1612552 RepID=A0AAC9LEY9_9PSEU|nr:MULTISPECIES: hypothetical protein [Actinoalloteichus]APU15085.1 hypothetical protein UA74_15160 [Actinoalloteichus fjordicus]APU21154.1 hypothetical protein UA75_15725 [Actinoalloteichus sp. GBA129-24]
MTAPVELVIHYLAVDEQGRDDANVLLMAPHTPLQYPDSMTGTGGVVVVPRVGETITVRTRRYHGDTLGDERNETWEVVGVHWTMSDISRAKKTPTQVATLRVQPSALDR